MTTERFLINQGHVHHFIVKHDATGWDVCEEEDSTVIRQVHHNDWHRVERAVMLFDHAALVLEREGWVESAQRRA
jgi:hypothetical protein